MYVTYLGMMIIVFVSDDILPHIKNVDTAHVGTGILGKMVNMFCELFFFL